MELDTAEQDSVVVEHFDRDDLVAGNYVTSGFSVPNNILNPGKFLD